MRGADAVDHFVDGAVASGGDNRLEALLDGALGLGFGVAGPLGRLDHDVAGEPFEVFEARPDAPGGGVGDDANAIQDWLPGNSCDRFGLMRALRWILGMGAVMAILALLAIAAGAVWLNTFIHSAAFKHEVEARAGRSLGGTVQIQAVDFDIFHGVKLQGFVTQIDPAHASGQGALQVKVASVNCAYAWRELFNRRLKLTGVTLDNPQIVLTKQATAPLAPSEPAPASFPEQSTTPGGPETSPATSTTSAAPGGPVTGAASGQGTSAPFQFILDRAKIKDGAVSVRDANGASLVELQGVNAEADTAGYTEGKDVTGTLKVADMALPSNLRVTNFSTPFTSNPDTGYFTANPFGASAYGGRIAGDYKMGMQPRVFSILNLNGKDLDVAQLTAATTSHSSAKLSGSLDLSSKWRGAETGNDLDGEGDAQLANGKLEGVKILHDLSQILRVNELDGPVITRAQTHFLVANRLTQLTGLQIESPIFRITGDGVIGFDGALNLNLVLILTKDAMGKLPTQAAASFVQQQDGTGSIAFHVTGTTAHPQTDLAERLLLQNTQIKNAIDKALNKFFH